METRNSEKIRIEKNGKVFLILPNKKFKSTRNIGYIRNRTFCTLKKENHVFREFNAFGLNYKLLNEGEKYFDFIRIEYDFRILETSRKFYLVNGKFKHFQQNNLEKQIFLPLELYGLERAKSWEQELVLNAVPVKAKQFTKVFQMNLF